ncbi:hypothetical protein AB0J84_17995 [Micromonospora arborensis]|uniref:hypothetical protein n=1 Tax=Micromonospora arborensis TaxID=2116518 RepID=UPI003419B040
MTSVECSPWQIAWAERENQRRQRAYRDATDAWQRRNDHLARLRVEAASFLGCTQPRTGLPVDLDADELVFRIVPGAKLVEAEARHLPGLPTPGPCDFAPTSDEALPTGLRVVDTGLAVVTSHRVAFAGSQRRREWRYADLVGTAHHPDVPVTLLPDHSRLLGLLVPANTVVNFRFYLTLAAADDRAAVTAQVDALQAAHQRARPVPMPSVGPDEAPLTAVRPDRRALGAAAVATVVLATLGSTAMGPGALAPRALGSEQAGPAAVAEVGLVPVLPVGPVGPVGPKTRAGSVSRATPTRPPAPRPAQQVVLVARPVVAPVPLVVPPPAPAVSLVPTPGPVPTTDPAMPALPTPSAAPTPTGTPLPDATLLTVCLDPLQLPLLDQLLCPSPAP